MVTMRKILLEGIARMNDKNGCQQNVDESISLLPKSRNDFSLGSRASETHEQTYLISFLSRSQGIIKYKRMTICDV